MQYRSDKKEWVDLGPDYYTPEEYRNCLRQLGRIGRILGGDRATLLALRQACPNPQSILDVGCGGGDGAARYAAAFPQCTVRGIDTSLEAIQYAKQKTAPNLSFAHAAAPELQEKEKSYDVVAATLLCHHLPDDELISFIIKARKVAKTCVIINDLHRHWAAYTAFALAAPILFPNRLIRHDGLLSIKRSFKKKEWEGFLKQAGIESYTIKWRWAFRWVITIPSLL